VVLVSSTIIVELIEHHAFELASLHETRESLLASELGTIRDLARFDNRLAAHLDGCVLAGQHAVELLANSVASSEESGLFALAVVTIEVQDRDAWRRCVGGLQTGSKAIDDVMAALGWAGRDRLVGVVQEMMASSSSLHRKLACGACRLHRVDPGAAVFARLGDSDHVVRAEALRTAGEIGRSDVVSACTLMLSDVHPECQFWAANAAVLLGNRGAALEALRGTGLVDGPRQLRALRLALQAMSAGAAHETLRQLAKDPGQLRRLIQGSGIAGDAVYVPWLIKHMSIEKAARLAGEAFSLISGVDLGQSGLEGKQPEGFESGPNDDPDDPNVEMDPDDGLPWPDPQKVGAWWASNGSRFQKGTRYFMGAPVTREHCIDMLKNGYQRQRILAAHYLCLLEPGTPLFNTSAPAWRQQRLLAKMT
jgi:uncharacterized protein (TIGR02270 family)